ncbi:hypothetical protein BAUCODRAFT_376493 [Baudoinia panamericana UAMH 10762]|uniref:Uncharacterized protein n=1 Tax=Baudoinia panamericana (strain UAMH 10762) TaxID=717646 RepID=M2NHV4_BAUPA|nr:uncharacterized protein BAUCODRAFT_376493 [Baudoinia panamericana UAMH 10762]EMC98645.1 hypothetical protein BAUCODRAFT_376493 [Baudoinia panamericana UAMH 10762]
MTLGQPEINRTLLDAREKPLTISTNVAEFDWPALVPRSASAPPADLVNESHTETLRPPMPVEPSTNSDQMNDVARLTSTSDALLTDSICLRSSTVFSATTKKPTISRAMSTNASERRTDVTSVLSYDGSEDGRIATSPDGGVTTSRWTAERHERKTSSDMLPGTAELPSKPPSANRSASSNLAVAQSAHVLTDSRPHSPSPASFSRPRPSSAAKGRSLPSPTSTAAIAAKALRAEKTASRLPIPDTRKATLVDVRSSRTSATSTRKLQLSPTFGRGRLDLPETFKILDQGVKRRQRSQPNQPGHSLTATLSHASSASGLHDASECTDADRSFTSTPDQTFATTSSDEEELTTPTTYQPTGYPRPNFSVKVHHTQGDYETTALDLFNNAVSALEKSPPSNSPYTEPLQTIPSQVVLPSYSSLEEPGPTARTGLPREPTMVGQPFLDVYNDLAGERVIRTVQTDPRDTKASSITDLLDDYAADGGHLSLAMFEEMGEDRKRQFTRTYSLLEGKGTPPRIHVGNEDVREMYSKIMRRIEKSSPKRPSSLDNAAPADTSLAQVGNISVTGTSNLVFDDVSNCEPTEIFTAFKRHQHDEAELQPTETGVSKWSESTASVKRTSPVAAQAPSHEGTTLGRQPVISTFPPRRSPPHPPQSIGYPTTVPSKAYKLIGPGQSGHVGPAGSSHRYNVLPAGHGRHQPGSVKHARDTIDQSMARFARNTSSTQAKRSTKSASKMPTPNTKLLEVASDDQRGRVASSEVRQSVTGHAKKTKVCPKHASSRTQGQADLEPADKSSFKGPPSARQTAYSMDEERQADLDRSVCASEQQELLA